MKAKYGLYDYTKGGTWMMVTCVDENLHPLMTMEKALEIRNKFYSHCPDMGVCELDND